MDETKEAYLERITKWWDDKSDSWYPIYRTDEIINGIVNDPASSFHHTTYSLIRNYIPDLAGKKVLVPSSGDSHAVFSFALMGAKVTSTDISLRQIEGASQVAQKRRWDIEFNCENTMTLSEISSNEYDFVYTSNGVHVWINDLESMYKSIHRVLKKSGLYIMFDIHPYTRPFKYDEGKQPEIVKQYTDIEPHYHWRIQDLINTMICCGFRIKQIEELCPEDGRFWDASYCLPMSEEKSIQLCDWQYNPMAALPQLLSVCIQKE